MQRLLFCAMLLKCSFLLCAQSAHAQTIAHLEQILSPATQSEEKISMAKALRDAAKKEAPDLEEMRTFCYGDRTQLLLQINEVMRASESEKAAMTLKFGQIGDEVRQLYLETASLWFDRAASYFDQRAKDALREPLSTLMSAEGINSLFVGAESRSHTYNELLLNALVQLILSGDPTLIAKGYRSMATLMFNHKEQLVALLDPKVTKQPVVRAFARQLIVLVTRALTSFADSSYYVLVRDNSSMSYARYEAPSVTYRSPGVVNAQFVELWTIKPDRLHDRIHTIWTWYMAPSVLGRQLLHAARNHEFLDRHFVNGRQLFEQLSWMGQRGLSKLREEIRRQEYVTPFYEGARTAVQQGLRGIEAAIATEDLNTGYEMPIDAKDVRLNALRILIEAEGPFAEWADKSVVRLVEHNSERMVDLAEKSENAWELLQYVDSGYVDGAVARGGEPALTQIDVELNQFIGEKLGLPEAIKTDKPVALSEAHMEVLVARIDSLSHDKLYKSRIREDTHEHKTWKATRAGLGYVLVELISDPDYQERSDRSPQETRAYILDALRVPGHHTSYYLKILRQIVDSAESVENRVVIEFARVELAELEPLVDELSLREVKLVAMVELPYDQFKREIVWRNPSVESAVLQTANQLRYRFGKPMPVHAVTSRRPKAGSVR